MNGIILAFWFIHTYQMEDRRTDDVINTYADDVINIGVDDVIYISDTLAWRLVCYSLVFLLYFDVICDLLLNRRTAAWDLFVKFTIARRHFIKKFFMVRDVLSILT